MVSKTQYDRVEGKTKTVKQYREEILKEISNELRNTISQSVCNHIISGNFNQDVNN